MAADLLEVVEEAELAVEEPVILAVLVDAEEAAEPPVAEAELDAEDEAEPEVASSVEFFMPHTSDWHAVWPSRSLGWLATQLMIHCSHSKNGTVWV